MLKAVIYDMDGVLINSEPYWREAIVSILKDVGLEMTAEKAKKTMGLRIDQVVDYWYDKVGWEKKSPELVCQEIIREVERLVLEKGEVMEGVAASVDFFKSKGYRLALASSSNMHLISSFLNKIGIKEHLESIRSGEHEEYSKPHPAIFINTAKDLGVKPESCLVIEDSFNGLIAAKAARMKTIFIPDQENQKKEASVLADCKLRSLNEINDDILNLFL